MPTPTQDELSYGDGAFTFQFKDGSTLKLHSDGTFEHFGKDMECSTSTSQPQILNVQPPQHFYDTAEAHLLTLCLGGVGVAHVVNRGRLAALCERNRSIEAIETAKALGSVQ